MKDQVRVLGFDDAPFHFGQKHVRVVGVLMCLPSYMEAVLSTKIQVDGRDATEKLAECISMSNYAEQPKAMMLDGIAMGGFNLVDLEKLWEGTGIPVITITRDKPDIGAMKEALKKHFDDWEYRCELITKNKLFTVETRHQPLHVSAWGISQEDAAIIIRNNTIRGAVPECLRVAHLIARGIVEGESRGRA